MYIFAKRTIDILFSIIVLLLTWPIMLVVAILIKLESKGEAIFKQERAGYKGQKMKIYKFRSMVINSEPPSHTTNYDSRITKVGKFIRKYKIDELPQVFNLLNGTMTLVGPRPDVFTHFNEYKEYQKHVFDVLPGITGLASFVYKYENDLLAQAECSKTYYREVVMQNKIDLNLQYNEVRSLIFDIKIMLATAGVLKKVTNPKTKEVYSPIKRVVKKRKKIDDDYAVSSVKMSESI